MSPNDAPRRIFVSDFDGTMTDVDFFELARQHLVPPDAPDYWQQYLAGQLTLFEVLSSIFASIRTDEETMLRTMRLAKLDARLREGIERLRGVGWEIEVASAGCAWYIERLLGEQGVTLTIHANPGRFEPERGLMMSRATDSPFYSEAAGINKAAIVRHAQRRADDVAFAGDSLPDLQAALLVPPERRFARAALAAELREQQLPFREYETWYDIAERLVAETS